MSEKLTFENIKAASYVMTRITNAKQELNKIAEINSEYKSTIQDAISLMNLLEFDILSIVK